MNHEMSKVIQTEIVGHVTVNMRVLCQSTYQVFVMCQDGWEIAGCGTSDFKAAYREFEHEVQHQKNRQRILDW